MLGVLGLLLALLAPLTLTSGGLTLQQAWAGADLETVDRSGSIIHCSSVPGADGVLLGAIVPCLIGTVQEGTIKVSAQVVDWLRPLFYVFLTLIVTLYGVRVLTGEPDIYKHGIVLGLKISLVALVVDSIPYYWVPQIYAILSDAVTLIVSSVSGMGIHCNVAEYSGSNTMPLWPMMDCVLGKLFGFTTGSGGQPNMILYSSMFGLLSGFFFGGAWGVVVFFGLMGVLISVFLLVVRTAMSFLSGYLTLCVMMVLLPLILPLTLLRVTDQYVQKAIGVIMGGMLLPVLTAAYAMFALTLYDRMLFSDDSILNTLLDQSKMSQAWNDPKPGCSFGVVGKAAISRSDFQSPELIRKLKAAITQGQSMLTSDGSNVDDPCKNVKLPNLVLSQVNDPEFNKGRETIEKLFIKLVELLVLALLVKKGADEAEQLIPNLTGSSVTTMVMASTFSFSQKLNTSFMSAGKQMAESFGQYPSKGTEEEKRNYGTNFLNKAPGAVKDAVGKFMTEMRR